MTNKNIIEFKTLHVHFNYKPTMLKDANNVSLVSNAIHYLIHKEEKVQAQKKMEAIFSKLENNVGNLDILTADEKTSYDNYMAHITLLDKLIKKTGFTYDKWDKLHDTDKIFIQLLALPNFPKAFGEQVSIITQNQLLNMLEIAENYYADENGSCKDMQNQLAYDLFFAKKGGNIFNGIKLKPNATDTKKFLALFITDIKLNESGQYDFASIWGDKSKLKKVQVAVNKFLAMYINNRHELVSISETAPKKDTTTEKKATTTKKATATKKKETPTK